MIRQWGLGSHILRHSGSGCQVYGGCEVVQSVVNSQAQTLGFGNTDLGGQAQEDPRRKVLRG